MAAEYIYLHAGLNKTGSSSIQRAMFTHRRRLLSAGITFWDIQANHSWPFRVAFGEHGAPVDPDEQGMAPGTRLGFGSRDDVLAHLRDALDGSRSKFVISGEGISRLDKQKVERLAAVLREFKAQRIAVIIYVREPRGLLHSTVQQRLKAGNTLDKITLHRFHYRDRIEKFFEIFGRENVQLRQFGSTFFAQGDLLSDFFVALGEPASLARSFPTTYQNISLSHRAALLMDAVSRSAERDSSQRPFNWLAKEYLRPYLSGKPFRVPIDTVEEVVAFNLEDIQWISAQLGADLLSLSKEEDDETSHDAVVDYKDFGELVYRLATELATLKADENYRRGVIALDGGRLDQAKRLFRAALARVPDHAAARAAMAQPGMHASAGFDGPEGMADEGAALKN